VGIDHYLPFYDSSSDAVHGGAQGFYRMGLPTGSQDNVLLAGASDYGLADPIQNTAYCLKLLDVVFLFINPTLTNILSMKLLTKFFDNIGELAVKIHKEMEQEIRNNKIRQ
jgi:hypothetical protein